MSISPFDAQQMIARLERNKIRQGQTGAPAELEAREDKVHEDILSECAARGWMVLHARMDRPTTTACGDPDFLILADGGRTFVVEAKSRTGKPTVKQLARLAWAAKLGHATAVVRSVDEFRRLVDV